jgi:hypothetical protein
MTEIDFVKAEKLWLKGHSTLSEKWVQDQIARDPALLGLGELDLRDKERVQHRAGRLDLLLQDPKNNRRYEVEVQLGKTDESHIIRTLEYWDIERKRYPQYDHCAVIVAEDITARFLNVISMFNGTIPIVAIQMNLLKVGQQTTLVFTTVLNDLSLGLVDEDEEQEPTDRGYWEERGTKEGQPNNFAIFSAKKKFLWLEVRLDQSDEVRQELEKAGLDVMDYDVRYGRYSVRLTKPEVEQHSELLKDLLLQAYKQSLGQ